MALPVHINSREKERFVETSDGEVAVRTLSFAGLVDTHYDSFSLAVTTTTDTYSFFSGGLAGTLVKTVTITYTDDTKATISTAVAT